MVLSSLNGVSRTDDIRFHFWAWVEIFLKGTAETKHNDKYYVDKRRIYLMRPNYTNKYSVYHCIIKYNIDLIIPISKVLYN